MSASVPTAMVGKKVRCTKCKAVFTVPASSGKSKRSGITKKSELSGSGGMKRPAKKSSGLMWMSISLAAVLLIGGGAAGVWFAMQEGPAKHAKAHPAKLAGAEKSGKDELQKQAKLKDGKSKDKSEAAGRQANKAAPPKKHDPGEVKEIEPVAVAALAASSPLELKDLSAVRGILPINNDLNRIGLHTVEGKDHFFEMYDLKKQIRIAKFKLAPDVEFLDVDPDGAVLATETFDKRFNIYTLPDGGLLADEWAPYDNFQDKVRLLSELGGKVNSIAMLSKDQLFVMSSVGLGDVWDVPAKKDSQLLIMPVPRDSYRKPTVEANRDFVLSPDRTLLAFATDEGIEIREPKTGKKIGSTPKLIKYGTKPEIVSMGFEPGGTKLTVYFSAGNDKGRSFLQARFAVPEGKELLKEELAADPGLISGLEFVNDDHFFTFDRNAAILRDGQGKTVAECRIPVQASLFAPTVVRSSVAYTFMDAKKKPSVGLATLPLGGKVAAPPPTTPTAMAAGAKGKSIAELFAAPTAPTAPTAEPTKTRVFEQQELWEFGPQGILKKGIKSFDRAAK